MRPISPISNLAALLSLTTIVTSVPRPDNAVQQDLSVGFCISQIPNFPWVLPSVGVCNGASCGGGVQISYECTGTTTVTYDSSTVVYQPVTASEIPLTYSISGATTPVSAAAAQTNTALTSLNVITETLTNSIGVPTATSTETRSGGLNPVGGTGTSASSTSSSTSGGSSTSEGTRIKIGKQEGAVVLTLAGLVAVGCWVRAAM